jgi:hypothetical protein
MRAKRRSKRDAPQTGASTTLLLPSMAIVVAQPHERRNSALQCGENAPNVGLDLEALAETMRGFLKMIWT